MSECAHTARDLAEASLRDLTTRYLELLDFSVHSRFGRTPVTVRETLERLATSEAISRYVHNGRQVDILAALNAGASWRDVGDVLDAPEGQLRGELRVWVEGQRELYDALQLEKPGSPPTGLSPAQGDAVRQLAAQAQSSERPCGRE